MGGNNKLSRSQKRKSEFKNETDEEGTTIKRIHQDTVSEEGTTSKRIHQDTDSSIQKSSECSSNEEEIGAMKPPAAKVQECQWSSSESDSDDDDDTIYEENFGIEQSIEANREQPPDIFVGADIYDFDCHPKENVVVVGTYDNELISYKYNLTDESTEDLSSLHHDDSIRNVAFSKDGNIVYSTSSDRSIALVDMTKFEPKKIFNEAHECAISAICPINVNLFATGDDSGVVKLWDARRAGAVCQIECGEDTINQLIVDENEKVVIAAVNDGYISTINIGKRKLGVQSERMGKTLPTCMTTIRSSSHLVVGCDDGRLRVFRWGEFGLPVDTIPTIKGSITSMKNIGNSRLVIGYEEGRILATNIYPTQFFGKLGHNKDVNGVDAMHMTHDMKYLASCGSSDVVKFWDLQYIHAIPATKKISSKKHKKRAADLNLASSRQRNVSDFFLDMGEVSEEEDGEPLLNIE